MTKRSYALMLLAAALVTACLGRDPSAYLAAIVVIAAQGIDV